MNTIHSIHGCYIVWVLFALPGEKNPHSTKSTTRIGAMTQLHTYDVAIIGAGPIGLELAACLKRAGVDYIHFDSQQIGYTLTWWPRNTSFFSTTERLAI